MIAAQPLERHGSFSSSNIWKLMTTNKKGDDFGTQGLKYIKQVKHEINLGRAINPERDSRPTSWGKFVERRVFDLLDLRYQLVSAERLQHPEIKCWTGAPDNLTEDSEADIKCPFSLEVFCDKVDALNTSIEVYKKEFPEDFWQHVSNSILSGKPFAEAIIYCPYQSELAAIREMAANYTGDQNSIAWINWAEDQDLPYLIEGRRYKNLNIIRWEVSEEDKAALTERVKLAASLLIEVPQPQIAE